MILRHTASSELIYKNEDFITYITKCITYGDSVSVPYTRYDNWVNLMSLLLDYSNQMRLFPFGLKPSESFFEKTLFRGIDNTRHSAQLHLYAFQDYLRRTNDKKYPRIEITDDLVDNMRAASSHIADRFVPILAHKNTMTEDDFRRMLHNILDDICLKRK